MDKYKRLKKIRIQNEKKKEIDYRLFSKIQSKDKTLNDYQNGVLKIW